MSNKYPGGFVSLGGPLQSYSVLFNGSSQYLTVASDAAFAFGTGDFTIEAWVYTTASGRQDWFDLNNGTSSNRIQFIYDGTNVAFYNNGSLVAGGAYTPVLRTWTHYALVRASGTAKVYVNGTQVGSSGSSSTNFSANPVRIAHDDSTQWAAGNISNVRIVKGTALYTANFVSPTGPFQNISGTSLLTCQSATIVDNSSNGFTVTNNGTATVSTVQPNFQSYNPNNLDPALGAATPGMWTLSQALNAEVTRSWPMYDPYYKNVVLNLHGEGTNGAQNNTFVDSSASPLTITRNGNTTQGSFSPYGQGWSNYFSGSGSTFIYANNTAALQPSSSDFTFECWFYCTATTYNGTLFSFGNPGVYAPFNFYLNSSLLLAVPISTNGSSWNIEPDADIAGTLCALNTWNHVSLCRSGTTIRVFLNGVVVRTTTGVSGALMTPTENLKCGSRNGSEQFTGYISNWRWVVGTALYTSNFTPSTAPLTAVTNTQILWCSTNAFKDATGVYPTYVYSTAPSVQRFSPFLFNTSYTPSTIGGSNYADGTGANYLTAPANSAFALGSNSFTVEGWIYLTQFNTYNFIYNRASGGTNATTEIELNVNSSGTLNCSVYVSSTQYSVGAATGAIKLNQWQHIAFVRNGTSGQIYINGVASGSAVTITGSLNDTSSVPNIRYQAPSANRGMTGYLADFRLVNGTAVYTGTFAPPTGPFSASMGANPFGGSNTAAATATLLLNSTNSGIVDNAMMSNLETVGNAQISTSVKKYGTASIYLDGNGDYLPLPDNARTNFRFGTGDFTIEFWAWKSANGVNGYDGVIGADTNGNASGGFAVELSSLRGFVFYNDASVRISSNFNPNDSIWHHYAVVRANGVLALYKDGIQLTTAAYTGDLTCTPVVRIGIIGTNAYFNGYIDDLRVTKGVARYVANFTPPTSQLQDQ